MPFVDVKVTNDWFCPEGWTEIFSRPWYGIKAGCDCQNKCCSDNDDNYYGWCNEFGVGSACDNSQLGCGCKEVYASTLVWQSQFYEVRICGLPGGDSFLNVTRPNVDGECPDNTSPCI